MTTETSSEVRAAAFEAVRPMLFSVAYRMLGVAAAAEDVVQDAYLRYQATDPATIRSLRSFLTTVVTRLCLDELKSARAKRTTYVGPWLPEPIVTLPGQEPMPEERVDAAESVSLAFLVVLESLSPVERAVFLLHEVFDYSYAEIGEILGRSEAALRQVGKRAKHRVSERRPRYQPSREERARLLQTFFAAAAVGDVGRLTAMLAEDAISWSDGGGKAAAALKPIVGRERVVRLMAGLGKKFPDGWMPHFVDVNGEPGVVFTDRGAVVLAAVPEFDGDVIRNIYIVRNPEKLSRVPEGLV